MEPRIIDIYRYAKEYSYMYRIMEFQTGAKINYRIGRIYLNPLHNMDIESFTHEIFHHHFEIVEGLLLSEEDIERISQEYYRKHKSGIEYIVNKIVLSRINSSQQPSKEPFYRQTDLSSQ